MKVNRAKFIRKYLRFFRLVYHINPPYHIILDGNFIFAAMKNRINILDRLQSLLQVDSVHLYVLKSSISELKSIGEKGVTALNFATTVCTILDDDRLGGVSSYDMMIRFIGRHNKSEQSQKRRYFVCSQDRELRAYLGGMPGQPLIYLNQVTLVMEPPSAASRDQQKLAEDKKVELNESEQSLVARLSSVQSNTISASPAEIKPERKKRKAIEPNPLSKQAPSEESLRTKKKRDNLFKRARRS